MNNIRIECSNQQCRRVMRESELVTTRVKGTVQYQASHDWHILDLEADAPLVLLEEIA